MGTRIFEINHHVPLSQIKTQISQLGYLGFRCTRSDSQNPTNGTDCQKEPGRLCRDCKSYPHVSWLTDQSYPKYPNWDIWDNSGRARCQAISKCNAYHVCHQFSATRLWSPNPLSPGARFQPPHGGKDRDNHDWLSSLYVVSTPPL